MSIDIETPWGAVINGFFKLIDKVIPDPVEKAKTQLAVIQMQQNGELKELDAQLQTTLAQIAVDNTEAASASVWKSGWRPFIGWICGCGLIYQFLINPLLSGFTHENFPSLDTTTLMTLLGGMLGLGTLRTVEKAKGVD